jgi:murein DD-endopeptidase MepM/ murein hydrolase activator NlpD
MVNKMKRSGVIAILRRRQYVIAGAFVMIAVTAATMIYSSGREQTRSEAEKELAENIAAAEEENDSAEAVSSIIPPKESDGTDSKESENDAEISEADATETINISAENDEEIVVTTAAATDELSFSPEDGMLWPLEGNVILNYSMDGTVYFATLDQYKYNPAVIIAGEVNDKVYSVAKGKVESIVNSEETGCTVTVDLGDGYKAVYGQLKELNFAEGDYVESGHVLGYISEPTKYYATEGSSLYFRLQKDGEPVDPVAYFE